MRPWYNVPGHIYDLSRSADGRNRLTLYGAVGLIAFAIGGLVDRTFWTPEQITPEDARFGWNEAVAKQEAPRIAALMPKFAITDSDGNQVSGAGQSAELWRYVKLANGGKYLPSYKQETGDCVSFGAARAIAVRQAYQITHDKRNEALKYPFQPYIYGISRVQIGKRQLGRGAGSVGAWAAQGCQSYGVLSMDSATSLGYKYSGQLADQWGWSGPPESTIKEASKFRIRTVSQVRSWEDVRDALVHGYPVTVASNVGFTGGQYDLDGKRWLRARGTWGHQMCFVGVEDRPGRTKGAYVMNSWGADAHPKPLNDEPPGGFWASWQDVQRMVSQNDSWAYSDFDGFPGEEVADWNAFKTEVQAHQRGETEVDLLTRSEQPDPLPVLMEVRSMFSLNLLWCCLACGVVLGGLALASRFGKAGRVSSALILAALMIYGSTDVDAGPRRRAARYQAYQQACQQQAATAANCVCPAGSCCNGSCANCPASPAVNSEGWKCGPGGCTPPVRQTKRQARAVHASTFHAFPAAEASATVAVPVVWSPMPEPVVVRTVSWAAFGG